MEQNSPSIARRRAPFARPAQAFPVSPPSKTNLSARIERDSRGRCETQLSPAKQLTRRAHENHESKTPWGSGSRGFRSIASRNRAQNSTPLPPPSPGFSTTPAHDSGDRRPHRRTQLIKIPVKSSPNAADSHRKAALVQCLLPHPRLRNGPSALNLPRIRQRVVFLLRRQDAISLF